MVHPKIQRASAVRPAPPTNRKDASPQAFTLSDLAVVIAILAILALLFTPALARTRANDQTLHCLNNMRQLTAACFIYAEDDKGTLPSTWTWVLGNLNYQAFNADNTNINLLVNGLLGAYVPTADVYKCPADKSLGKFGSVSIPRVRSVSMNQMIRPDPTGGHSVSPPWTIYKKYTDIIRPAPASLWVVVDENPDSINDASFSVTMDYQGPYALWQSGPSTLHNGGCNFSFADSHCETKQWTDRRSVTGFMKTTYTTTFLYGLVQPNNPDIQWVQDKTTVRQ